MIEEERKGDWIRVFSGKQFWTIDPREEDVDIIDIAHGLSLQCRYTGQCNRFYSVAEHSCHMFDKCSNPNRLWALLHDASEAYISDINRPTKPYLTNYYELENRIMKVICERFDLVPDMPHEVRMLDNAILVDEMLQNLSVPWQTKIEPLGVTLQYWSPEQAEKEFLERFKRGMMETI